MVQTGELPEPDFLTGGRFPRWRSDKIDAADEAMRRRTIENPRPASPNFDAAQNALKAKLAAEGVKSPRQLKSAKAKLAKAKTAKAKADKPRKPTRPAPRRH